MTTANSMSTAAAGHLTRAQILTELGHKFHAPDIAEGDDITDYVDGPIEALADSLNHQPLFAARRLSLIPTDVANVTKVGQLVSVIDWGLRNAPAAQGSTS